MTGRMYSIQFNAVAVTAAQEFFALVAASTCSVIIHGWDIGQASDYGDAQAEGLRLLLIRGYTTASSGGNTVTPVPLRQNVAAAASTARINDTTLATAGTPVTVHATAWNIQAGSIWIPTPEMRPSLAPGARAVLRSPNTPTDSITMSGTLYFEEVG